KIAYVEQNRESLEGDKSVYDNISGGADFLNYGKVRINTRAYCGKFNFKGSDQQKLVKYLSGGERNRLLLATTLTVGGNLLLLDEPTNDLDVDTLRSLEEGLLSFSGCAVIISHDRWFLDRTATHILAFEGNSEVFWHEGNFESYEAVRKQRLGADADQPHRIKYKKLAK
ncbi:MAG: ATP-binding cassette domain-containing protein, partial [Planctomycetes bacterium]|nr:ATP-binding cassette domain-containing protein [Planctomycetota bacterium]